MNGSLHLIIILLAVAVGVVVLCRILHLPVMLGYLLVGITIGPHALGWIPDTPETHHLAEFGVVFLMFSIGLEFSLARLRAMQRLVFGLGTAQVAATMLLVMLSSLFFDLDWRAGLALGGILAMSSTAIVSKMLVERAELNVPHGQKIMGVLLFQDLAVVPLIIIIPALAAHDGNLTVTVTLAMLKAAVLLAALLIFGQRLLRPWFHLVARTEIPRAVHAQRAAVHARHGLAHRAGRPVAGAGRVRRGHADLRDRIPLPGGRGHQAVPRHAARPVLRHHRHDARHECA